MIWKIRSFSVSALWLAALVPIAFLGGCVSRQTIPFRTIADVCQESSSDPEKCSKHLLVRLRSESPSSVGDPSPFIGFVEFDDLGFQMPKAAIKEVTDRVRNLSDPSDPPLLIVAFIHGWHHSANPNDSNVKAFQDFLRGLQAEENQSQFTRRQVVGVYLGWRGDDKTGLLSKPLSFDERKLAAIRIGQYGVQELLAELGKIRRKDPRSRLVAVGHSFGGANLISAVYQTLVNEIVVSDVVGPPRIEKLYGDMIVLINPAIEASRFETMHRRIGSSNFDKCQPVVLASFTSDADSATEKLFPAGQRVLFSEDADGYMGESSEDREVKKALVRSTYGWYGPYVTHQVSVTGDELLTSLSKAEYDKAYETWKGFRSGSSNFRVGGVSIASKPAASPPHSPVINARVPAELIPSHNEIWKPAFSLVLRALVGMEFAKADTVCKDG